MTSDEIRHRKVMVALAAALHDTFHYAPAALLTELTEHVCKRIDETRERTAAVLRESDVDPALTAAALTTWRVA